MNADFWKSLLRQIVSALLPKIGGFKLWILNKILDFGGSYIHDLLTEMKAKAERAKEQEIAKEKKDEIVSKPEATADEVGKAYEDYYNSGRH